MADGTAAEFRLTPKQAKFAALYVELGNASEAYRRSYDVSPDTKDEAIHVNASKLLSNAKVALRVDELQEEALEVSKLNRAWVLKRLMRNVDKALELEDLTASNKALELLGKVDEMQMFVERSNVTSDNRHTHAAQPLSPFAEFLTGAIGRGAEGKTEGSVPE